MAGGLKLLLGPGGGRRRRAGWLALVLGVVVVHGCVTSSIVDRMADAAAAQAMPPRMEVAYVREMELSAPPVVTALAAPPALVPRAARARAAKPAKPASAPEEDTLVAQSMVLGQPDPHAADAPALPAPEQPAGPASAPAAAATAVTTAVATAASAAASAASIAASVAASAPANATYEWPTSTRLSYELTGNYRGEVVGSAQVEWLREGSHYQVHLDLLVGPSRAPLITRRMSSDGEITAQGLSPRRYDQDTKVVLRDRTRVSMLFEPDTVTLANGDRRDRVPGLQDSASQFVQLTYLFSTQPELLKVGVSLDMPLALPNRLDVWTYDVVEEETLRTPFGPLPTVRLKPRRSSGKPGDLTAEIWFAPQLRYLPVRIRIEQDAGTYVDLMIAKRPEVAGP